MVINWVSLVKVDERGPVSVPIKISETAIDFSGNWTELLKWNNVFFCHLTRTRIMLHKQPQWRRLKYWGDLKCKRLLIFFNFAITIIFANSTSWSSFHCKMKQGKSCCHLACLGARNACLCFGRKAVCCHFTNNILISLKPEWVCWPNRLRNNFLEQKSVFPESCWDTDSATGPIKAGFREWVKLSEGCKLAQILSLF